MITLRSMLLGAVSVLVIVTGLGGDDSTVALERALRSALGPAAAITVRPATPSETDDELRASAAESHVSLVGVVTETDDQHATIRFARPHESWNQREIRFDPNDAPRERGRTIGFALASAVPDESTAPPPPEPPPPPPRPPPITLETPARQPPAPVEHDENAMLSAARAPWIDAVGIIANGIDGYGGGGGGGIAGRFVIGGAFRLRVGLSAWVSDVPPAQASTRMYAASVGLAWQPWTDREHHYGLGARVDALVIGNEVSHFDADDPAPARRFRVLPGANLALEAAWRFTESAGFVVALGPQVAFGKTDLYIHDKQVATVAPFRAMGETGLRVFF